MKSSIKELQELETGLVAHMRHLHNSAKSIAGRATADSRDLNTAEQANLDRIMARFDAEENELVVVKAELAAALRDEQDGTPLPRKVAPVAIYNGPGTLQPTQSAPSAVASPLFNRMFPQAARNQQSEFSSLGDFAKAVMQRDPRLFSNAASGAGESVGADGGFYVPSQMYASLMDMSLAGEAVRPNATIIPMSSASLDIPMFDTSNRSTGIATLEGKLTPEGATGTTQKPKVRSTLLTAHKISILVPTTSELLQDAPQLFSSLLEQAMTDALGQTLDTWFISGTGAGVPLGILNAPCLVSVSKDTSQVAATLTPTNLAGMVARMAPGSWARAQWLVSPSALAQLFTIKTVIQNVAASENVGGFGPNWFTSNPDGTFMLLGRPLIVSDRCSALGVKGDVILADLKSYLVGLRQNAELLVDTSIGFKESEIWFRLNCRVDGQPALAAPITPRVGSATLSPFVTLDAR